MTLMPHRIVRLARRVLLPMAVFAYVLFTVFDIHTRNLYNNHVARVEPYKGGQVSDVKRIRCYIWHGTCNQIIEKNGASVVTWYKVEKPLDLDGVPFDSWTWYHSFLYVQYSNGDDPKGPGRAIVDMALGNPDSTKPPEYVIKDARTSTGRPKSRLDITYNYNNWDLKQGGIWVKYDRPSAEDAITDLMYLFGTDIIEPRADWRLASGALKFSSHDHPVRITMHRESPEEAPHSPVLMYRENEFKILQLSDMHFTSELGQCKDQTEKQLECKASANTLSFIHQVLDNEQPQLVVITGDLLDGDNVFDYQTALLRALSPLISRKLPYAIAMGEHDNTKIGSRNDIVEFITSLPYSMMVRRSEDQAIQNITNYVLPVLDQDGTTIISAVYVLDLLQQSVEPVSRVLHRSYDSLAQRPKLSIAFQHLPIQEYRPHGAFAIVGSYNEKHRLKSSKTDKGTRRTLGELGVQVMSVGSEHTNDCCIRGDGQPEQDLKDIWLCFGGAVGEGGYGLRGYDRRVRLFRFNSVKGEITSWKRRQGAPGEVFDYQFITNG